MIPPLDLRAFSIRLGQMPAPVAFPSVGFYSQAQHCVELAELLASVADTALCGDALLHRAHIALIGWMPDASGKALRRLLPAFPDAWRRVEDNAAWLLHDAVGLPWPVPTPAAVTIASAARQLDASARIDLGVVDALPAGVEHLSWRIRPQPWDVAADAWLARLRVLAIQYGWRGPAVRPLLDCAA